MNFDFETAKKVAGYAALGVATVATGCYVHDRLTRKSRAKDFAETILNQEFLESALEKVDTQKLLETVMTKKN